MTKRSSGLLALIALFLVATLGDGRPVHALQDEGHQKPAASVAGRWTLSVKGGPHGDMTMGLELEQKGKQVSGTFSTPHGDLQVAGEFIDGALTLATAAGGESQITLTAKLKDHGTLDGFLSSQLGDMTWTAERASGK